MKLTIKVVFMLLISLFISMLLGISIILIINGGMPRPETRLDAAHAGAILLVSNFFGLVLFGCLVYFGIIRRINNVHKATKEVINGNYSNILSVKGKDELSLLSVDFNKMTAELRANEYLNKEYAKNVSHEIKTPLSSILGYAILLSENNYSYPKVKQFSQIIAEEAERMINVSTQLLKLSMVESSNIIKKDDIFCVDEQIRETIILMQNEWQSKQISVELEEVPSIEMKGNRSLTQQVWQNLISNAIKYSKKNGLISINLRKNEKLRFEIIDNGVGISEENKQYIFNQFYTGTANKDPRRTGIGLSLTRKIVEKLGGTIWFESELGKGSSFFVELPIE